MFDEDSQPCVCSCGEMFDLEEGNTCGTCFKIFCEDCVEEPFDLCKSCDDNK
jgi:hypothetical protein